MNPTALLDLSAIERELHRCSSSSSRARTVGDRRPRPPRTMRRDAGIDEEAVESDHLVRVLEGITLTQRVRAPLRRLERK